MFGHLAAGRARALRKWTLAAAATAAILGPGQALARYASFVIDAQTGRTLSAQDADTLRYPASLTKMMTLYMLFEQLEAGRIRLDDEMPVSVHASVQAPTKLGLRPGQSLRVRDAILGLVTKSANDAAVVVAEHIGGSEPNFAAMMTRKAHALGMSRTVFQNASGLPNPEQVTTARDMAMLGVALNEHFPAYYRFFATRAFVFRGRVHANHNHLLGRVAGVDGIKTGYIRASGFNLVSSVRRDGRHIVAAVLGGPSARARDAHMRELISGTISAASSRRLVAALVPRPGRTAVASAAPAPATEPAPTKPQAGAVLPVPQPKPVSAMVAPAVQPFSAVAEAFAALGFAKRAAPAEPEPAPAPQAEPSRPSEAPAGREAKPSRDAKPSREPSHREAPEASRDGWAIQIGAVDSEEAARDLLKAAKNEAGAALKGANPVTEKVVKGGQTLYRARFAGFADRDEAQTACSKLKHKAYACIALRE